MKDWNWHLTLGVHWQGIHLLCQGVQNVVWSDKVTFFALVCKSTIPLQCPQFLLAILQLNLRKIIPLMPGMYWEGILSKLASSGLSRFTGQASVEHAAEAQTLLPADPLPSVPQFPPLCKSKMNPINAAIWWAVNNNSFDIAVSYFSLKDIIKATS